MSFKYSIPGPRLTEGKVVADDVRGEIRLENVRFRHPTSLGIKVLSGLFLNVQPST
jgi:hypothetical protein